MLHFRPPNLPDRTPAHPRANDPAYRAFLSLIPPPLEDAHAAHMTPDAPSPSPAPSARAETPGEIVGPGGARATSE